MEYTAGKERTREIGVRTALGAQFGEVVRRVLVRRAVLAVSEIGVGQALALEPVLKSCVFEVSTLDKALFQFPLPGRAGPSAETTCGTPSGARIA